MIIKKTPEEIDKMAAAGSILVRTMNLLAGKIRPGVSTRELDQAAEKFILSQGAEPAFKGYRGFPGSICASPNSMIVHGIPGPYKLDRGDIISVDIGVVLDGWVADAARTFAVGPISPVASKLLKVTEESLFLAVEQVRLGNRLGDVSNAIQRHVESNGLSIVRTLVGHGIGRSMHEDPQIPNYGEPGTGVPLEEGMVLGGRADGHRRPALGPRRRGPLGDLLAGRVAGGALRVHDRGHPRWAAGADAVARGGQRSRGGGLAQAAHGC